MPNEPKPRAKDSLRGCVGARCNAAGIGGAGGGGLIRTSRVPIRTLTLLSGPDFLRSLELLDAAIRSLGLGGIKVVGADGISYGCTSRRGAGRSGGGSFGGKRLTEFSDGSGAAGDSLAFIDPMRSMVDAEERDSDTTRAGVSDSEDWLGPAAVPGAAGESPNLCGRGGRTSNS